MKTLTKTIETLMIVFLLAAVANAAGDAKAGKAIFTQHCANCHMADGTGNPKLAAMMHVTIPHLGSPTVQKQSDAQLEQVVKNGKAKMPPIHGLTDTQVDDVIAYVRTFKK